MPVFETTVLREETAADSLAELRCDVLSGLRQNPKELNSMYFYDDAGSELYARITEEEEYYLTKFEHDILTKNAGDIVGHIVSKDCQLPSRNGNENEGADGAVEAPNNISRRDDAQINIIELGAGDGRKTKVLLRALLLAGVDFKYFPIDISARAMKKLFSALHADFIETCLHAHGIVGGYVQSLEHIYQMWPSRQTLVLFLGSSIGNFAHDDALDFLTRLRSHMKPCDLLLAGFDLKKDRKALLRAYSDSNGVTRDFNLNLLTRLNRELDANFDVTQYHHLAIYNPVRGAMESYLVSDKEQDVNVAGECVHFRAGETLHTENSFKYSMMQVSWMTNKAGFSHLKAYTDDAPREKGREPWFLDMLMTS